MTICMVVQFEEDLFLLCSGISRQAWVPQRGSKDGGNGYLTAREHECTIILE